MKFVKGQTPWNKGLIGFQAGEKHYRYGKTLSEEVKHQISQTRIGKASENSHWNWKGDLVGYRAIHNWVEKQLGKPMICTLCNDTSKSRYHWANISLSYLRDKNDWIRLCPSCHYQLDRKERVVQFA